MFVMTILGGSELPLIDVSSTERVVCHLDCFNEIASIGFLLSLRYELFNLSMSQRDVFHAYWGSEVESRTR